MIQQIWLHFPELTRTPVTLRFAIRKTGLLLQYEAYIHSHYRLVFNSILSQPLRAVHIFVINSTFTHENLIKTNVYFINFIKSFFAILVFWINFYETTVIRIFSKLKNNLTKKWFLINWLNSIPQCTVYCTSYHVFKYMHTKYGRAVAT